MADMRSRIRLGDQLARAGRFAEAVDVYLPAGIEFANLGFALKAIAVLRQVVTIVDQHVPTLGDRRVEALQQLLALYSQLGLTDDAKAISARLARDAV